MKIYSENKNYKLYNGNMLDMLEVIEKESIDSIVTDPPYGLTSITKRFGKEGAAPASTKNNDGSFARLSKGFMGKEWDGSGIEYNIDTWKKCYEVLKPGGYLLAFGGSRTYHRIACAIEDAGFEIRDTIMWLYGSGFPKSMNIGLAIDKKNGVDNRTGNIKTDGKATNSGSGCYNCNNGKDNSMKQKYEERIAQNEWQGWGTALKPSFEPIIVARKPFKGSCVDNIIKYGVGGINIDECRVEYEKTTNPATNSLYRQQNADKYKQVVGGELSNGAVSWTSGKNGVNEGGRFPANTILTYDETDFEEVCGGFSNTKTGNIKPHKNKSSGVCNFNTQNETVNYFNGDSGSASRYFYCAKANKKDRDEGLEGFEATTDNAKGNGLDRVCEFCGASQLTPEKCLCETKSWITKPKKNTHPTVKPTQLMQYLVRLVTPNGGTILDPFNGSGSTGKAVMYENKERNKNYKYIGIELTEEYLPIAKARIEFVCKEDEQEDQMNIYDILDK